MRIVWTVAAGLLGPLAVGCVVTNSANDGDTSAGGAGSTSSQTTTGAGTGGSGAGTSTTTTTGAGGGLPGGWTTSTHPCVGNRTDALHVDADGRTWVGCGTTTTGFGLFTSADGVSGWAAPETNPAQFFDGMRVNSISRSSDGKLYVAGTTNGGPNVVAVDTSASPAAVENVLVQGNTTSTSFTVGTFRRADDGSALAESLTGNAMLYRTSDAVGSDPTSWVDAYYWAEGGTVSYQLLDLEVHDGGFYGCGSTIADTPKVYLPDANAAEPWLLQVVELGTYNGEMWSLAVAPDGRVVVGGVDQNADQGMIYVSDLAQQTFTEFDMGSLEPDRATWIRGVCTNGDRIVAAGEFSQTSDPLLLVSDDHGATFTDVTPAEAPGPLSQCVLHADGSFVVAGAEGFIGIFRP